MMIGQLIFEGGQMTAYNFRHILTFLDDLDQNNAKVWFDSHRPAYEAARGTFGAFIDALIDQLRESDHLQDLSAKECILRINRDIRFTKDKSPYNTSLSAMIAPGGRKSGWDGYYISIGPRDRTLVAGGLYMPSSEQLNAFRQSVDRGASEFNEITHSEAFIEQFGEVEGERLKTAPQGYPRDHPEISLLQLKQVTAVRRFSDNGVLAEDFPDQALKACRAMKPFLDYINGIQ
jgi:uncharacterized protein (TIGR02453 family)